MIASQEPVRRLTAVMVADVAGYVRLMEAKEESVHARIIALRNDIIDPLVEANNGQIVKNTGDGFFATFETVREGFQCAVVLQEKVAAKEHGYEPGERIAFRMCINLCEAIFEKGDVFGDGVNIAACNILHRRAASSCRPRRANNWEPTLGGRCMTWANCG
jgi:adenylate cyclase